MFLTRTAGQKKKRLAPPGVGPSVPGRRPAGTGSGPTIFFFGIRVFVLSVPFGP